jgi:RNA polymerase sigma-70 factor, ECF subfamily
MSVLGGTFGRGLMSSEEEHDLIVRAKMDAEAFGDLYQRYVTRIYNYHYRHTSNRSDAEDLTSRTFYRALRSLHSYRETGAPFQAWLFRIAHNLVVNWYRDHANHPTVSMDGDDYLSLRSQMAQANSADGPEAALANTELRTVLVQAISRLPEDRKTLIILKFVEEMTNVEIGEVLGRTEGAIKALYHRTLITLRLALREGAVDVQEIG